MSKKRGRRMKEINEDFVEEFDELDFADDVVILTDDEGKEHEFGIIDVVEVEDSRYVILMPTDDEEGEAIVMKVEVNEDEEEVIVEIEDDAEWEKVQAALEQMFCEEEEEEKAEEK